MKVLFLSKARGVGEIMLIDGFIYLLGKNNIHFESSLPLDEYDLVLLFRDFVISNFSYIKYVLKQANNIVFIDVFDDPLIHKLFFHPNIIAYFKRELYNISFSNFRFLLTSQYKYYLSYFSTKNMFNFLNLTEMIKAYRSSKLKPLPLSYIENPNFKPSDSKTINVSYMVNLPKSLNIKHKLSTINILKERINVAKVLKQFKKSFIYLGSEHRKGLPHETYLKILSQSLCVVSTYGMGFDTVRYWEIPYSGSVLISRRPRTLIPNNLEEGKHAFFFDNLRELKQHVEYIIEDPDTALKIGKEARKFVMKYHSPEARARTIINALTQ
jgi:glycosyltransferase involved in cell wall biosynthesis